MSQKIISIATGCIIFLFAYTAISKWLNIPAFRAVLAAMPLLSNHAAFIAYLVPATESVLVLLLLFKRTTGFALMASAMLLSLFTAYLLYALSTHQSLPCSCGGIISSMSWTQHIIFNTACIGLCICAVILNSKKTSSGHQTLHNALLQ